MIVAFSVTPLGVGEEVSGEVARAVQVVRSSGLPNHTDAMFTTIERAVSAVAEVAPRVSVVLKADIRPSVHDGLTSKVESLEQKLADL